MSFDICLQLWKHPHNHASKPICRLPTFPLFLSCHPSFSSFPTLFLSAGNHRRLFCHHRIIYVFWDVVHWIIRSLSPLSPSRPLWPGFYHYDIPEIPPWSVCQQPSSLLKHTTPFYAEFTVSMPWLDLIDWLIDFFKLCIKGTVLFFIVLGLGKFKIKLLTVWRGLLPAFPGAILLLFLESGNHWNMCHLFPISHRSPSPLLDVCCF